MNRWYIFFAIILCIYSALHLYLLIKVRRAYYLESWSYLLIVVCLVFLMTAPMQARVLESQGHHLLALTMAWIGFLWMGGLFIWIWLSLIMDAYHIAVMVLQRILCTDLIHLMLSRRQSLSLTFMVTFGLMVYGAYTAQNIRVERHTISSKKIPAAADPIRIVQISDLHLGQMIFPGRLDRIINAINKAQADIVVSTGDLVDGHIFNKDRVIKKMAGLKAKMGKFAVTGNHEAYAGERYATELTQALGFTLLQGKIFQITKNIAIVGVDDPAIKDSAAPGEAEVLSSVPARRFTILLKHQPRLDSTSKGRFDLQLSGHTHEGQIFPFSLVIRWAFPLFAGLYPIPQGGRIYVSPGTGTWGPPIRLGAPPKITIFDVQPPQKKTVPPLPAPKQQEQTVK